MTFLDQIQRKQREAAKLRQSIVDAADSGNVGRAPDDWELRRDDGSIVSDLSVRASEAGIADGGRLWVVLGVGVGGSS